MQLIECNRSSASLGHCEVCHKWASDVYHLFGSFLGKYRDVFGHQECLKSKQADLLEGSKKCAK